MAAAMNRVVDSVRSTLSSIQSSAHSLNNAATTWAVASQELAASAQEGSVAKDMADSILEVAGNAQNLENIVKQFKT
jgi:methyl-accepting chemotaxis protein